MSYRFLVLAVQFIQLCFQHYSILNSFKNNCDYANGDELLLEQNQIKTSHLNEKQTIYYYYYYYYYV